MSEIAKVFDLLDLQPVVKRAKIFVQCLWKLKLEWDEKLQPQRLREWKAFIANLSEVNKVNLTRYILRNDIIQIDLH